MYYNTKYVVRLTEDERETLHGVVTRGKVAAQKRMRAQVLLKADAGPEGSGPTDRAVAEALLVSQRVVHCVRRNTPRPASRRRGLLVSQRVVHCVRQAYVEEGLSAAIERKPRRELPRRKLDGAGEARLVALACSPAPAGQARWTLQLLSDKLVELQVVASISRECVRQTLKKTTSSRG
jgi:hypothetical protein